MRTTTTTARGRIPLAVLLLTLAWTSWAVMGEGTLHIDQAITPNEIFVAGTDGEPDTSDLTLTLSTVGPAVRYPMDCLLLIDVSETSDLVEAKDFATGLIEQFGVQDRVGLISYSTTAELEMPMTHNLGAVKLALNELTAGGRSAMGLAMQMARREFEYVGRDEAIFVIILVTDGQSSVGPEPDGEGEAAAQQGIEIISVGLGTLINRNLLETFADQTGGLFFESPSDRTQTSIFTHLFERVAASDVVLRKSLPSGLRFVESTPKATQLELRGDGTSTAVWRLGDLELNGGTTLEMVLEAVEQGTWETDTTSQVEYTDFRGVRRSVSLSPLTVTALLPNEAPMASFLVATEGPWIEDHDVSFEDLSLDTDGEVVGWSWDFGDGEMSAEQHPTHAFADPGQYEISLIATDEEGAESKPFTVELSVRANEPPLALFSVSSEPPMTVRHDIAFEDASTDVDGDVVAWEWDFGDGTTSTVQDPEHAFAEIGEYTVSLVAIDEDGGRSEAYERHVVVEANRSPTASFDVVTEGPLDTMSPVDFADTSTDPDGEITAWAWTFGDGTTSAEKNPSHQYEYTGTFEVSLTVTDEDGARSRTVVQDVEVELGPRIEVTRTIQTCLPGDETVPGGIAYVTLLIEVRGAVNGMAVVESIPDGWTFMEGQNDGATIRKTATSTEWLFVEKLVGDATNAQREIRYTLQAPAAASGTVEFSIRGTVGSSAPRFDQPILGEDKFALREYLAIPVVISRWDTDANELKLCEAEPEVIDFAEIQYAISLWLSGGPVPQTNNLSIDVDVMQDLIAYWLTGRSVHDSLP